MYTLVVGTFRQIFDAIGFNLQEFSGLVGSLGYGAGRLGSQDRSITSANTVMRL